MGLVVFAGIDPYTQEQLNRRQELERERDAMQAEDGDQPQSDEPNGKATGAEQVMQLTAIKPSHPKKKTPKAKPSDTNGEDHEGSNTNGKTQFRLVD